MSVVETKMVARAHIATTSVSDTRVLIDLENVRDAVFEANVYPHIRIQPT